MFNNSFMQVFDSAPWFTGLIVILLTITVVLNVIKAFRRWKFNKSQPVLTIAAKVLTKRDEVIGGNFRTKNKNDYSMFRYAQSFRYFVTFEVENGKCLEFRVKGREYDLLAEQVQGKLTFQGTRYLGFVKTSRTE